MTSIHTNDEQQINNNPEDGCIKEKSNWKNINFESLASVPYVDRASVLSSTWQAATAPIASPALLHNLHRITLLYILQEEWSKLDPSKKDDLREKVQRCSAALEESGNEPGSRRLLHLLGISQEPWNHPVLKDIMEGRTPAKPDVEKWCRDEGVAGGLERLRQLCAAGNACTGAALRMARALLVLENSHGARKTALDTLLVLLFKKGDTRTCISEIKALDTKEVISVIRRLSVKDKTSGRLWKHAHDTAILCAQVTVAACLVKPIHEGELSTLCGQLAMLYSNHLDKLISTMRKLIQTAETSVHIYTVCRVIQHQYPDKMRPLVCELYIRALTTGMNELERLKLQDENSEASKASSHTLARWFVNLSDYLASNKSVSAECVLTAFSLHPSKQYYNLVEKCSEWMCDNADSKGDPVEPEDDKPPDIDVIVASEGISNLDIDSKKSEPKKTIRLYSDGIGVDGKGLAKRLVSGEVLDAESLGLTADACNDLAVLISGPRLKMLTWELSWKALSSHCLSYMEDTAEGTKAITKELKFVKLDYSQFEYHEPEIHDIYFGIEKGYEHHLKLDEEEEEDDEEEYWENQKTQKRYQYDSFESSNCDSESEPNRKSNKQKKKSSKNSTEYDSETNKVKKENKKEKKKLDQNTKIKCKVKKKKEKADKEGNATKRSINTSIPVNIKIKPCEDLLRDKSVRSFDLSNLEDMKALLSTKLKSKPSASEARGSSHKKAVAVVKTTSSARESILTVKTQESNSAVKPQEYNSTVKTQASNLTVKPQESNLTVKKYPPTSAPCSSTSVKLVFPPVSDSEPPRLSHFRLQMDRYEAYKKLQFEKEFPSTVKTEPQTNHPNLLKELPTAFKIETCVPNQQLSKEFPTAIKTETCIPNQQRIGNEFPTSIKTETCVSNQQRIGKEFPTTIKTETCVSNQQRIGKEFPTTIKTETCVSNQQRISKEYSTAIKTEQKVNERCKEIVWKSLDKPAAISSQEFITRHSVATEQKKSSSRKHNKVTSNTDLLSNMAKSKGVKPPGCVPAADVDHREKLIARVPPVLQFDCKTSPTHAQNILAPYQGYTTISKEQEINKSEDQIRKTTLSRNSSKTAKKCEEKELRLQRLPLNSVMKTSNVATSSSETPPSISLLQDALHEIKIALSSHESNSNLLPTSNEARSIRESEQSSMFDSKKFQAQLKSVSEQSSSSFFNSLTDQTTKMNIPTKILDLTSRGIMEYEYVSPLTIAPKVLKDVEERRSKLTISRVDNSPKKSTPTHRKKQPVSEQPHSSVGTSCADSKVSPNLDSSTTNSSSEKSSPSKSDRFSYKKADTLPALNIKIANSSGIPAIEKDLKQLKKGKKSVPHQQFDPYDRLKSLSEVSIHRVQERKDSNPTPSPSSMSSKVTMGDEPIPLVKEFKEKEKPPCPLTLLKNQSPFQTFLNEMQSMVNAGLGSKASNVVEQPTANQYTTTSLSSQKDSCMASPASQSASTSRTSKNPIQNDLPKCDSKKESVLQTYARKNYSSQQLKKLSLASASDVSSPALICDNSVILRTANSDLTSKSSGKKYTDHTSEAIVKSASHCPSSSKATSNAAKNSPKKPPRPPQMEMLKKPIKISTACLPECVDLSSFLQSNETKGPKQPNETKGPKVKASRKNSKSPKVSTSNSKVKGCDFPLTRGETVDSKTPPMMYFNKGSKKSTAKSGGSQMATTKNNLSQNVDELYNDLYAHLDWSVKQTANTSVNTNNNSHQSQIPNPKSQQSQIPLPSFSTFKNDGLRKESSYVPSDFSSITLYSNFGDKVQTSNVIYTQPMILSNIFVPTSVTSIRSPQIIYKTEAISDSTNHISNNTTTSSAIRNLILARKPSLPRQTLLKPFEPQPHTSKTEQRNDSKDFTDILDVIKHDLETNFSKSQIQGATSHVTQEIVDKTKLTTPKDHNISVGIANVKSGSVYRNSSDWKNYGQTYTSQYQNLGPSMSSSNTASKASVNSLQTCHQDNKLLKKSAGPVLVVRENDLNNEILNDILQNSKTSSIGDLPELPDNILKDLNVCNVPEISSRQNIETLGQVTTVPRESVSKSLPAMTPNIHPDNFKISNKINSSVMKTPDGRNTSVLRLIRPNPEQNKIMAAKMNANNFESSHQPAKKSPYESYENYLISGKPTSNIKCTSHISSSTPNQSIEEKSHEHEATSVLSNTDKIVSKIINDVQCKEQNILTNTIVANETESGGKITYTQGVDEMKRKKLDCVNAVKKYQDNLIISSEHIKPNLENSSEIVSNIKNLNKDGADLNINETSYRSPSIDSFTVNNTEKQNSKTDKYNLDTIRSNKNVADNSLIIGESSPVCINNNVNVVLEPSSILKEMHVKNNTQNLNLDKPESSFLVESLETEALSELQKSKQSISKAAKALEITSNSEVNLSIDGSFSNPVEVKDKYAAKIELEFLNGDKNIEVKTSAKETKSKAEETTSNVFDDQEQNPLNLTEIVEEIANSVIETSNQNKETTCNSLDGKVEKLLDLTENIKLNENILISTSSKPEEKTSNILDDKEDKLLDLTENVELNDNSVTKRSNKPKESTSNMLNCPEQKLLDNITDINSKQSETISNILDDEEQRMLNLTENIGRNDVAVKTSNQPDETISSTFGDEEQNLLDMTENVEHKENILIATRSIPEEQISDVLDHKEDNLLDLTENAEQIGNILITIKTTSKSEEKNSDVLDYKEEKLIDLTENAEQNEENKEKLLDLTENREQNDNILRETSSKPEEKISDVLDCKEENLLDLTENAKVNILVDTHSKPEEKISDVLDYKEEKLINLTENAEQNEEKKEKLLDLTENAEQNDNILRETSSKPEEKISDVLDCKEEKLLDLTENAEIKVEILVDTRSKPEEKIPDVLDYKEEKLLDLTENVKFNDSCVMEISSKPKKTVSDDKNHKLIDLTEIIELDDDKSIDLKNHPSGNFDATKQPHKSTETRDLASKQNFPQISPSSNPKVKAPLKIPSVKICGVTKVQNKLVNDKQPNFKKRLATKPFKLAIQKLGGLVKESSNQLKKLRKRIKNDEIIDLISSDEDDNLNKVPSKQQTESFKIVKPLPPCLSFIELINIPSQLNKIPIKKNRKTKKKKDKGDPYMVLVDGIGLTKVPSIPKADLEKLKLNCTVKISANDLSVYELISKENENLTPAGRLRSQKRKSHDIESTLQDIQNLSFEYESKIGTSGEPLMKKKITSAEPPMKKKCEAVKKTQNKMLPVRQKVDVNRNTKMKPDLRCAKQESDEVIVLSEDSEKEEVLESSTSADIHQRTSTFVSKQNNNIKNSESEKCIEIDDDLDSNEGSSKLTAELSLEVPNDDSSNLLTNIKVELDDSNDQSNTSISTKDNSKVSSQDKRVLENTSTSVISEVNLEQSNSEKPNDEEYIEFLHQNTACCDTDDIKKIILSNKTPIVLIEKLVIPLNTNVMNSDPDIEMSSKSKLRNSDTDLFSNVTLTATNVDENKLDVNDLNSYDVKYNLGPNDQLLNLVNDGSYNKYDENFLDSSLSLPLLNNLEYENIGTLCDMENQIEIDEKICKLRKSKSDEVGKDVDIDANVFNDKTDPNHPHVTLQEDHQLANIKETIHSNISKNEGEEINHVNISNNMDKELNQIYISKDQEKETTATDIVKDITIETNEIETEPNQIYIPKDADKEMNQHNISKDFDEETNEVDISKNINQEIVDIPNVVDKETDQINISNVVDTEKFKDIIAKGVNQETANANVPNNVEKETNQINIAGGDDNEKYEDNISMDLNNETEINPIDISVHISDKKYEDNISMDVNEEAAKANVPNIVDTETSQINISENVDYEKYEDNISKDLNDEIETMQINISKDAANEKYEYNNSKDVNANQESAKGNVPNILDLQSTPIIETTEMNISNDFDNEICEDNISKDINDETDKNINNSIDIDNVNQEMAKIKVPNIVDTETSQLNISKDVDSEISGDNISKDLNDKTEIHQIDISIHVGDEKYEDNISMDINEETAKANVPNILGTETSQINISEDFDNEKYGDNNSEDVNANQESAEVNVPNILDIPSTPIIVAIETTQMNNSKDLDNEICEDISKDINDETYKDINISTDADIVNQETAKVNVLNIVDTETSELNISKDVNYEICADNISKDDETESNQTDISKDIDNQKCKDNILRDVIHETAKANVPDVVNIKTAQIRISKPVDNEKHEDNISEDVNQETAKANLPTIVDIETNEVNISKNLSDGNETNLIDHSKDEDNVSKDLYEETANANIQNIVAIETNQIDSSKDADSEKYEENISMDFNDEKETNLIDISKHIDSKKDEDIVSKDLNKETARANEPNIVDEESNQIGISKHVDNGTNEVNISKAVIPLSFDNFPISSLALDAKINHKNTPHRITNFDEFETLMNSKIFPLGASGAVECLEQLTNDGNDFKEEDLDEKYFDFSAVVKSTKKNYSKRKTYSRKRKTRFIENPEDHTNDLKINLSKPVPKKKVTLTNNPMFNFFTVKQIVNIEYQNLNSTEALTENTDIVHIENMNDDSEENIVLSEPNVHDAELISDDVRGSLYSPIFTEEYDAYNKAMTDDEFIVNNLDIEESKMRHVKMRSKKRQKVRVSKYDREGFGCRSDRVDSSDLLDGRHEGPAALSDSPYPRLPKTLDNVDINCRSQGENRENHNDSLQELKELVMLQANFENHYNNTILARANNIGRNNLPLTTKGYLEKELKKWMKKKRKNTSRHWKKDEDGIRKEYVRKILSNVPGMNDLNHISVCAPSVAVNVVQVSQLPVSSAQQSPLPDTPTRSNSTNQFIQAANNSEYRANSNDEQSSNLITKEVNNEESVMVEQNRNQNNHDNADGPTQVTSNNESQKSANENIKVEININENQQQSTSQDASEQETITLNSVTTSMSNSIPASTTSVDGQVQLIFTPQSTIPQNFGSLDSQEHKGVDNMENNVLNSVSRSTAATVGTATFNATSRAQTLVNILSQKISRPPVSTSQVQMATFPKGTPINALSLQQALAQILPPPLSQSSGDGSQNVGHTGPQVVHIVQGKSSGQPGSSFSGLLMENSQQAVVSVSGGTQVLHIVQGKNTMAGNNATVLGQSQLSGTSFGGLSLVDAGTQQGGNQVLHIVNTGQNKGNTPQLLKRVNLLTSLTNSQGNEQKMVQFVCKSSDGKSIQLNAQQRGMVLRLQPIDTSASVNQQKPVEPLVTTVNSIIQQVPKKSPTEQSQEIKSRSIYEENYAKFIQNSKLSPIATEKSSVSLPKFNQAFGKSIYQDTVNKNDSDASQSPTVGNEQSPELTNTIGLTQMGQLSSPPLLIRKTQPSGTTQNIIGQVKQGVTPMNIQTMHGGVIYTRQIPVNIGGGQTINLITVPSSELLDEAHIQAIHKQVQEKNNSEHSNTQQSEQQVIKLVPQQEQNQQNVTLHVDTSSDDANQSFADQQSSTSINTHPLLAQMRIKVPMLSKGGAQMVTGTRVVRPVLQIQRNIIPGTNPQVYQQLVLTTAPALRTPTPAPTVRPPRPPTATPQQESNLSTSTLEQLREFDMVFEQVKERSTVQPGSNSNSTFSDSSPRHNAIEPEVVQTSQANVTPQREVLYSIGPNHTVNVTYVNKNVLSGNPTVLTASYPQNHEGTAIVNMGQQNSPQIQIGHNISNSMNPKPTTPTKVNSKSMKPKSSKPPTMAPSSSKASPVAPKTSIQKPLEDEQTTQRILYILAEYKEQVENSPDKDKPAPRRRSNPPTNPSTSSKRKKGSGSSSKKGPNGQSLQEMSPLGDDAGHTMGSEDSSCGLSQGDCAENSIPGPESQSPQGSPQKAARKLVFPHDQEVSNSPVSTQPQRNVIIADGQTIAMTRPGPGGKATAVLMPANYILPMSMVKGGQQITIVTNQGPKILNVPQGEGGATNTVFLQRLISPAGLKPMLARPGQVRQVRLPASAVQNLQTFNLAAAQSLSSNQEGTWISGQQINSQQPKLVVEYNPNTNTDLNPDSVKSEASDAQSLKEESMSISGGSEVATPRHSEASSDDLSSKNRSSDEGIFSGQTDSATEDSIQNPSNNRTDQIIHHVQVTKAPTNATVNLIQVHSLNPNEPGKIYSVQNPASLGSLIRIAGKTSLGQTFQTINVQNVSSQDLSKVSPDVQECAQNLLLVRKNFEGPYTLTTASTTDSSLREVEMKNTNLNQLQQDLQVEASTPSGSQQNFGMGSTDQLDDGLAKVDGDGTVSWSLSSNSGRSIVHSGGESASPGYVYSADSPSGLVHQSERADVSLREADHDRRVLRHEYSPDGGSPAPSTPRHLYHKMFISSPDKTDHQIVQDHLKKDEHSQSSGITLHSSNSPSFTMHLHPGSHLTPGGPSSGGSSSSNNHHSVGGSTHHSSGHHHSVRLGGDLRTPHHVLRHKYALMEHELRLQKSLSEECEDLGVDSPSASDLFPEADLLFTNSPSSQFDHSQDGQMSSAVSNNNIATNSSANVSGGNGGSSLSATHSGASGTAGGTTLGLGRDDNPVDEEFARMHPNTTFHSSEIDILDDQEELMFRGASKRCIRTVPGRRNEVVRSVIEGVGSSGMPSLYQTNKMQTHFSLVNLPKRSSMNILSLQSSDDNSEGAEDSLNSAESKDDLVNNKHLDGMLNTSITRDLNLSASDSPGCISSRIIQRNVTQVIRHANDEQLLSEKDGVKLCCDENSSGPQNGRSFLLENSGDVRQGDSMILKNLMMERDGRDGLTCSSPEQHSELFWESNSNSNQSDEPMTHGGTNLLDFSSEDSNKCCKSPPSCEETNSTDSSSIGGMNLTSGKPLRLNSVIKSSSSTSTAADGPILHSALTSNLPVTSQESRKLDLNLHKSDSNTSTSPDGESMEATSRRSWGRSLKNSGVRRVLSPRSLSTEINMGAEIETSSSEGVNILTKSGGAIIHSGSSTPEDSAIVGRRVSLRGSNHAKRSCHCCPPPSPPPHSNNTSSTLTSQILSSTSVNNATTMGSNVGSSATPMRGRNRRKPQPPAQ